MKKWLFFLWIFVDIALLISSLMMWIVSPLSTTFNVLITVFSLFLALLLVVLKYDELKEKINIQYTKKNISLFINIFLMFSILGLLNFLGKKNEKNFDLSENKINTLSEKTFAVLDLLKDPLKMTFFSKRENWAAYMGILKLYSSYNKNISLNAIDTDIRPDLVKKFNVTKNNSLVIEYKNRVSVTFIKDELSITNALLKMVHEKVTSLYFVKGHEEFDCSDSSEKGISHICTQLQTQNYKIKDINLAQVEKIPSDADAIMILGPQREFLDQEMNVVRSYVKNGGNLFIALSPNFQKITFSSLKKLVKDFGLEVKNDIIIDRLSTIQGTEATIPIISSYNQDHPISKNFKMRTLFPLSLSVTSLNSQAHILATTSPFPGSWAESNFEQLTSGKAVFEKGKDLEGPIGTLGVASHEKFNGSRIGVLGSSTFLINGYQNQSGNTDLFLRTLSWLVGQNEIISLNRPATTEGPIIFSAIHLQVIFIISLLIVPLIFSVAAVWVYRKRRFL